MSENTEHIIEVTEEDKSQFKRLDQYLVAKFPDLSRNIIKSLFESKNIFNTDETKKVELKKMPKVGTQIKVIIPIPKECSMDAEDIPLDIIFEDEHLIIINKKAGMVVHPAPGNYSGTLVNAILHHCDDLTGVGDELRPGIVHRLDKGTSGIMVVAKSGKCHEKLVNLFSLHDIKREYLAIVNNTRLAVGGTIESTIGRDPSNRIKMAANVRGGKHAKTFYNIIESFKHCHYIKCRLETGRTHQIRVHLSQLLNAAILNDSVYAKPGDQLNRLGEDIKNCVGDYRHPFLHAKTLGFVHPMTGEELLFEQEPPQLFLDVLEIFRTQKKEQQVEK
jgi:23S rRNA pseudouridine1911/1915/1917 synthase